MRKTEDARGYSFWDVFANTDIQGQINISVTKPLQRRGFHLHKEKTDHWFCFEGTLLVVLLHPNYTLIEQHFLLKGDYLKIDPNIWHAYQNVSEKNSTLLYYETKKSGLNRADDYELPLDTFNGWLKKL